MSLHMAKPQLEHGPSLAGRERGGRGEADRERRDSRRPDDLGLFRICGGLAANRGARQFSPRLAWVLRGREKAQRQRVYDHS